MKPETRALARAIVMIAACALAVPAAADQVVYFVNGKAITVKKIEKGDRITILEMEGGGRIGIPTEQIERIEELQLPSAPAAPPPVLPAGGIGAQAQSAPPPAAPAAGPSTAATPPAAQSAPPGPSAGGQPARPGAEPAGLQTDDDALASPTASAPQHSANKPPAREPATGALVSPPEARANALGRTGGAHRRYNVRGGLGRTRPPAVNYVPPGGAGQSGAAPARPPAPPAASPAPQAAPDPEPPPADAEPVVAEPAPPDGGEAEPPADPSGDDAADGDSPEN